MGWSLYKSKGTDVSRVFTEGRNSLIKNASNIFRVNLLLVSPFRSIQKPSKETCLWLFSRNVLKFDICYPSHFSRKSVHEVSYLFFHCSLLDIPDI